MYQRFYTLVHLLTVISKCRSYRTIAQPLARAHLYILLFYLCYIELMWLDGVCLEE